MKFYLLTVVGFQSVKQSIIDLLTVLNSVRLIAHKKLKPQLTTNTFLVVDDRISRTRRLPAGCSNDDSRIDFVIERR